MRAERSGEMSMMLDMSSSESKRRYSLRGLRSKHATHHNKRRYYQQRNQ
jgi:hypothetical protein